MSAKFRIDPDITLAWCPCIFVIYLMIKQDLSSWIKSIYKRKNRFFKLRTQSWHKHLLIYCGLTVGISCKWAGGENAHRAGQPRSQKNAQTFLLQPDRLARPLARSTPNSCHKTRRLPLVNCMPC